MKSETTTRKELALDNELDIRGLCRTLWQGKLWIIGLAAGFALVALLISLLMKQAWSTTAVTDKPTVNNLASYFSQEQFLRNLDAKNTFTPAGDQASISDDAYSEFVMQLAAYDTRRDFWLNNPYYVQRKQGDAAADAVLLDKLIAGIQFTPRDDKKLPNDSVKLTAETAADANQLLRQYVDFASERASAHLYDEIQGAWAARAQSMKAQVKRQEAVATAIYNRELNNTRQALTIAQQQNIDHSITDATPDRLPDADMFLLGTPMLQARLKLLQASGPSFDIDYDQNKAMLATLNVGPVLNAKFQTYRYLRTPEEPVSRDSPRRALLMVMWGIVGGLLGAGVALARRRVAS
ncbi:ECA polysaccharide chain length modulation protein [Rouxiella chamberiensis]|uniref:ECA polysaccharide chain length modulation protein n=1 Tax=Rouxiella chamberiensis TaxID=1513468 RepID=UPI0005D38C0D|nr:ECA polysaccharide chain length modulation protein [Rouxiella chamberiensis]